MNLHPTYKISSVNSSLTPRSEKGVIPCLQEARQVSRLFCAWEQAAEEDRAWARSGSSHILTLHVRT